MKRMTEYRPHAATQHDYIPAAGRDAFLPGYDLLTRVLGMHWAYDVLVAQAELADGLRVLEIGCGTGNVTTRVKRAAPGADVVGTDPDPLALARAQRKVHGMTGIRFERAYAQELPFADGEFDRVLSSMMLHHLDDDTKAGAAAEIHRVLRPGGTLHIVDIGGPMTAHDGFMARRMLRSPHIVGSLGDAIPRLLRSVGFDSSVVASRRNHFIGRLTFYRAQRRGRPLVSNEERVAAT
jgi:ubiquinone/menaquinone biosynthesis C-methylase UbiE